MHRALRNQRSSRSLPAQYKDAQYGCFNYKGDSVPALGKAAHAQLLSVEASPQDIPYEHNPLQCGGWLHRGPAHTLYPCYHFPLSVASSLLLESFHPYSNRGCRSQPARDPKSTHPPHTAYPQLPAPVSV